MIGLKRIFFLTILIAGLRAYTFAPKSPSSAQPSSANSEHCEVTARIHDAPPEQPDIKTGLAEWNVSPDRAIWVRSYDWHAGKSGNKVLFIRPAGSTLTVTGVTRRNGKTVSLRATPDKGYPRGFTVLGITLPVAGCWQVNASTPTSKLTFVTDVLPEAGHTK